MHQPNIIFFGVILAVAIAILNTRIIQSFEFWFHFLCLAPASWTFQEYLAHRFLLHGQHMFQKIHFKHHRQPSSKLFIPMEITTVFAVCNFGAMFHVFGWNAALINMASSVFCYLAFEWTHWMSHMPNHRQFCEFHINHHRSSMQNFGFTSATWDIVFQTCDPKMEKTWVLMIPFPILPLVVHTFL